ncbi:MAG: SdrD B-like domain-containing protein [candidate division WOR-3 bacterium]
MFLFIISFQYYTALYHNLYDYEESSYGVTNWLVDVRESDWNLNLLFMKYKEDYGIKSFYFKYDSISIGKYYRYYHFIVGDIGYLRGLEVGHTPPCKNYELNLRAGKMKDLTAWTFPRFERNNFFAEVELFTSGHFLTLNTRWDKDRTSSILSDEFDIKIGDFTLLNDIRIAYKEGLKFAFNEDIIWRRELFFLRSFLRYYSKDFLTREGIEYMGGRLNWGVNPSYNFPFGLNVFSGFYQTGRLDSELQNQIMSGFSYRFPVNLSINFTNNINWGGDRESGYRNYLNLYSFFYNKIRVNFRYYGSYYNRKENRFDLESIINLPHSNILEGGISHSNVYGWEYSFGSLLKMGSSLSLDLRLRHLIEEERLNYNSFFSFGKEGSSLRVGLSGNTETNSKVYTLEFIKRGSIKETGFGGIFGIVWHDKNGDGKKQKEEPPLKDVKIVLDGKKFGELNRMGEFRFFPVSKGKHTVQLDIKGIPAFLGRDSLKKEIEIGFIDFKVVNFPIYTLSSISGVVYYDENHNGKRDPEEQGVPNVKVSIVREGYIRSTYTDFFGEYSIQNIMPGDYTVQASRFPPGYELSPKGFVLYLKLIGGEDKKDLNFGIARPLKQIERKEF